MSKVTKTLLLVFVLVNFIGCSFDMLKKPVESDSVNQGNNQLKNYSLEVKSQTISESDATAYFTVELNREADSDLIFNIEAVDLSALKGRDYNLSINEFVIEKGKRSQTIAVDIIQDDDLEKTEIFTLKITKPTESEFEYLVQSTIIDDEVCPKNYILIKADNVYTKDDFCVMKYEAKLEYQNNIYSNGNVDRSLNFVNDYKNIQTRMNYKALSLPEGQPWVNVRRGASILFPNAGAGAIEACQLMSVHTGFSGQYDLISNDQWQTIAQNIENVADNWSQGTVLAGSLNTGQNFAQTAASLPASSNDNQACFQTGASCDLIQWNKFRRTHKLSTGDIIWDISGNVWENVKDDNITDYGKENYFHLINNSTHPTQGVLSGGPLRTAIEQFGPKNDIFGDGTLGMGYAWLPDGRTGSNILRGGDWNAHNVPGVGLAGIFSVYIGNDVDGGVVGNGEGLFSEGFRCVFKPQ